MDQHNQIYNYIDDILVHLAIILDDQAFNSILSESGLSILLIMPAIFVLLPDRL